MDRDGLDRDGLARFFLAETPTGSPPRLAPGESAQVRARRLAPGDDLIGLDGSGGAWLLRVVRTGPGELELETVEPLPPEPPPGAEGAPLPWIEVAVAWPRNLRAEELFGRLVQLGAAAITPLRTQRSGPPATSETEHFGRERRERLHRERLHRIAREACKESDLRWLPELNAPLLPQELALARPGTTLAALEPRAGRSIEGMPLDTWARSITPSAEGLGTKKHPIVLAVGPVDGFTEEERTAFRTRGATSVRVAPHVLRIETAAEAALAVVAATMMR
ncbi:MAG: RsmE family RNA methyltransferase [Planctomycetota bacterium]|nr:RsmE family RNA methyltransferase [Planctomycetota bacterium]